MVTCSRPQAGYGIVYDKIHMDLSVSLEPQAGNAKILSFSLRSDLWVRGSQMVEYEWSRKRVTVS
jgi:hypothetical protein